MKTATARNSHLSDDQKLKFRLWLQAEFSNRSRKSPRYSLRAFAASLKLEPSSVSQILSGKRALSRNSLIKLCEKLSATPKDLKEFGLLTGKGEELANFHQLSMDQFAVIADWYHFAILEMTFIKTSSSDPKSIAKALGISIQDTKSAIERLSRLGLLNVQNGKFLKTKIQLSNHAGLNTSAAKKTLQRQVISKALDAIDDVPQEFKDITSITMAIDLKNLERARDLTQKFRRDLCALLEDGEPTQIYNLAIQLYPVSKGSNK